ncbi:helix-turn-helix domain-containing protein [Brachyspira hampsonii]|uniref:helix-turn-helix domain-containing protein n=1 Tax=Brachyspira hampsonii TaxID=1287055 RepID=UPI001C668DC7|nr:helix-turn-helix transcriptional regulator [Brachyspira hampsonii]MBW5390346.1 XRE family transcriptional regulator [Brachyspira hampsonii]
MKKTIKKNNNKEINNPIGGDFFDFLKEENILEECLSLSSKELIVYQLKSIMEEENISKSDLANKMNTSRAAVYRLLDENNNSVTLDTLEKAAKFLNKRLIIKFV